MFEEYFEEPQGSFFADKSKKAPFCALGDDCFEDVDHQKLTMEIKRMALALAGYLKTRMLEEAEVNGNGNLQISYTIFKNDL